MNNNDLISRTWVLAEYDRQHQGPPGGARKIMAEAPAVDAVPVVRCAKCKHRPIDNRNMNQEMTGFSIEFPDNCCPCQCEDGWYNWYPPDDWYCAYGKRRDGEP